MKSLFIIFITLLSALSLGAVTYEITALNTPSITINGKNLKKGDRFSGTSNIKWVDNKQSMEVKDLSTGSLYRFSRKVFESKGAILSISDFFLKTKEGSSRGDGNKAMFTESPERGNYPEKRIALVIGNSDYDYLSYLRNAQKDASDIAENLLQLGFDVMETYECTYPEMKTALNNFSNKAKGYSVALFYYAGHGLQEEGQNYLIPIDQPLEFKSQLRDCLNCEDIMQRMDAAGTPARMIFLDACRNAKKSWSRDATEGLARMESSIGSVIVFSTQSGKVASDGNGENSPFAYSLIKNISRPKIGFSEAMTGLVRDTYALTEQKQYPLLVGTLINDFSFNTPGKPISIPSAPKPSDNQSQQQASSTQIVTQQIPSTAEQPVQAAQPKTNFDFEGMNAYVEKCRRAGNDVILTLYLTNISNKGHHTRLMRGNSSGRERGSFAYDNMGNQYVFTERMTITSSERLAWDGFEVFTPRNIPVKLQIRLKDFPADANVIKRLDLAFRGVNPAEYYGSGGCKLYDIPVGFSAPTPNAGGNVTAELTSPDVEVKVTKAQYAGNTVIFSVIFTNTLSKDLECPILEREPTSSASLGNSCFYDTSAVLHSMDDMVFMRNGERINKINLPAGIPVTMQVRLKNFPAGAKSIPFVGLALRGIDTSVPYGIGSLKINNLPIQ